MKHLNDLPDEIVLLILGYLPTEPLIRNVLCLNKRIRRIALDDALWERINQPYYKVLSELSFSPPKKDLRNWYMEQISINRRVREILEDPSRQGIKTISEYGNRSLVELRRNIKRQNDHLHDKRYGEVNMSALYFAREIYQGLKHSEMIHRMLNVWLDHRSTSASTTPVPDESLQRQIQPNRRQPTQQEMLQAVQDYINTANRDYHNNNIINNNNGDARQRRDPQMHARHQVPVNNDEDAKLILKRLRRIRDPGTPRSSLAIAPGAVLDFMVAFDGFCWGADPIDLKLDKVFDMIKTEAQVTAMSLPSFVATKLFGFNMLPNNANNVSKCAFMSAGCHHSSPLALSCIYSYVARKFGIKASPVVLPFKTLVRIDEQNHVYFVDVERGGVQRSMQDLVDLARSVRRPVPTTEQLKPVDLETVIEIASTETQSWLRNNETLKSRAKLTASIGTVFLKQLRTRSPTSEISQRMGNALRYFAATAPFEAITLSVCVAKIFNEATPFDVSSMHSAAQLSTHFVGEHNPDKKFVLGQVFGTDDDDGSKSGVIIGYSDIEHRYRYKPSSLVHEEDPSFRDLNPVVYSGNPFSDDCPYQRLPIVIMKLMQDKSIGRWFVGYDASSNRFIPNKLLLESYPM